MTEFNKFFEPRSLAFVGASSDVRKWGYRVLHNIVRGDYKGKLYPVNPKGGLIDKLEVYKSLEDIPEVPDLAVIAVPPAGILQAIRDCGQKGIKACIVITAGFAEVGEGGAAMQAQMVEIAHSFGMRLVGPNCFGLMSTSRMLYAQMPTVFPPAGPIAVVSQSGNVGFTIARQAMFTGFGCSRVISTGNEADLHAEDFIEYLAGDEMSRVIMCYIEGFRDGRRFFEIASQASMKKPIIMIKVGETEAGASAARSHTAALSGSDAVFNGVCRQGGFIRVYNLKELMNVGCGFLCHPLPRGNRVGIVTLGGGWGVLASDACVKLGLTVPKLSEPVLRELDSFLPAWWSRNNPVDLVTGGPPDAMLRVIDILIKYEQTDAVLALGLPTAYSEIVEDEFTGVDGERKMNEVVDTLVSSFKAVKDMSEKCRKPVIFAAESPAPKGDFRFTYKLTGALARQNMVFYAMPDEAAMVLSSMARYSRYLQSHGKFE